LTKGWGINLALTLGNNVALDIHSSPHHLTPEDFLNGRIDERLKVRDEKLYQARLNRTEAKNAA